MLKMNLPQRCMRVVQEVKAIDKAQVCQEEEPAVRVQEVWREQDLALNCLHFSAVALL